MLKDLPEKIDQTIYVEMEEEHLRFYEKRRRFYYENIKNSVIDTIVVTNSIPATEKFKATGKFRYVSLAPTLAEAIRRINNDESISVMFNDAV